MRLPGFKRAASIALLSLLASAVSVPASFAATEQNITISPSSTLLSVAPGGTSPQALTIVNGGSNDFTVDLSVAPYHVEGTNYDPFFTQLPGTVNPSGWVTLSAPHLSVKADHSAMLPYTVHAPAGTPPGGYYAVIFAQTGGSPQGSSGVVAHNRVGNILYITVTGPVKNAGTVSGTPLPPLILGSSVDLGADVSNTGGIHFLSTVNTNVVSAFGGKQFGSSIQRFVLPQTTRLISSTWSPSGIIGLYKVSRTATVAGSLHTLPDQWIVVAKPQLIPILAFAIITIIGLLLLRRNRRGGGRKRSAHHDETS